MTLEQGAAVVLFCAGGFGLLWWLPRRVKRNRYVRLPEPKADDRSSIAQFRRMNSP